MNINSDNVERLFLAADRFQIFGLAAKCIDFLLKCLDYENVVGIRKFSNYYFCDKLKNETGKFLM